MAKFQASKNTLSIMKGICLILFALVILFSPNTPFRFLTIAITSCFGFVGFWILLPVIIITTILIIFKIKFPIKTGFIVAGLSMITISLGILFSVIHKNIDIHNAFESFKAINSANKGNYLHFELGGGFVGYMVAGAINSLITKTGTIIFSIVILLAAIFIIFNKQIISSFKKTKEKRQQKDENKQLETVEEAKIETDDSPNIIQTFHGENNLRKAHFNMEKSIIKEPETVVPVVETPLEEEKVESIIEEPINEVKEPEPEPVESKLSKATFVNENQPIQEIKQPEPIIEETENIDPLYRPQPKANLVKDYVYPSIDLLKEHENSNDLEVNESSCGERTDIINKTLASFRVGAKVVSHTIGPAVTRFDIQMDDGVSVNAIPKYIDDISVKLNGLKVRFESIVSGKSTSGLEVPNEIRTNVGFKEAIVKLPNDKKHLRYIPFGKNISGELMSANLSEFPHMLVSGTTGSGKTIFVHSVILTLIMRNKPEELKVLLIDPKKVEMNYYKEIPHLLCPNISEPRKAYVAMQKLVDEMERRYNLFQANDTRDIKDFNAWASEHNIQPLPYIVVFVDEYADLTDSCKEIKEPVGRIAQKARAAGIHLVLATQRPSVNIIDGTIKSNIATRVALLSASATDSITIIGEGGAEKLLGNGDMLIESALLSTCGRPRVQGCFVETSEITKVCSFLRSHYGPQYDPNFVNLEEKQVQNYADAEVSKTDAGASDDELYEIIKTDIAKFEYCSISFITRSYCVGFTRAGKLFRRLQNEGLVDIQGTSKGCKVLIYSQPNQEQQIGTIEQSTFIPDRN